MSRIIINGVLCQLDKPDLDGDGKSGGVEKVTQNSNNFIQPISQPTELGETLGELNKDMIEQDTRMTGIDLRANLHPVEVEGMTVLDSLVGLKFLPASVLPFTRQKKRLSVSVKGSGRQDIVNIAVGKREHDKETTGEKSIKWGLGNGVQKNKEEGK
ncbi:MAG: hypothetical protein KAS07_05835 [Candidatus Pacebacteria bacterium]|nr:hypothetical protein [Candidatus Paceibacterota bacterium]